MHESQLRRTRSGEPGLGRRAENEARAEVGKVGQVSRAQVVLGCWKRKKDGGWTSEGDARFLYPAKAAPGLCARLARCRGHGFLIQACRLVVYF